MKNRKSIAIASLLAAGCGTTYVEPTDGVAVTFRNSTPAHLFLMSYAGPLKCTDSQGISALPPSGEKTVRFQRSKVVTFSAQVLSVSSGATGLTSSSCVHIGSLVPVPGSSYTATITSTVDRCFLSITKRDQSDKNEPEATYLQRKYTTPLVASEGFCSQLSDAERQALKIP
jgi:hypothetical protein